MDNTPITQVAISTIKGSDKQDIYPKTIDKAVITTDEVGNNTTLDKAIESIRDNSKRKDFVVTLTTSDDSIVADKSYQQINEAWENNENIYLKPSAGSNARIPLINKSSNYCLFQLDTTFNEDVHTLVGYELRHLNGEDIWEKRKNFTIQELLVSGTSIKTVNSTSLLGEGNVSIPEGKSAYQSYLDTTSDNPPMSETEWIESLHGEDGVDLGEVAIVNNLRSNDSTKVLSALQGTILRDIFMQMYDSLGEYAFPNGKPTIDWSGGYVSVTLNLTDAMSSNTAVLTERGESYTTTLTNTHSSDNLYVLDATVTMGGEDITSTVYDSSTGVISISEVTGNIEITASEITYIQNGLVLHLDGKNRGGTAGHWVSLVDYNGEPIDFTLTDCDETHDDYVAFNGTTSKGVGSVSLLDVPAESGTIEAAYNGGELNSNQYGIMYNALGSNKRICLASWNQNNDANNNLIVICAASSTTSSVPSDIGAKFSKASITSGGVISCSKGNFKINQQSQLSYADAFQTTDSVSMLSLFWRKLASNERFFKGNLQSLRVYNRILTDAEREQNYRVDSIRFNLT